jgi:general stress protein 26
MANFEEKKTDPKEQLMGDEALNKIRELLTHFRSAMLTTVTLDGTISTRPMGLQGDADKFEGTLWFFADTTSPKAQLVRSGAHCAVVMQNDDQSVYLHFSGRASVERNLPKMQELYTPLLQTWFPDGLDDPNLGLIRFDADKVDYWVSPGGMFQVLGAFTKAIATGEPGAGGNAGVANLP